MIRFLARQKFRFDLGISFLTVLNFLMVCIAASPTISTATGVPARWVVIVLVPMAILSVWLLGYALHRARFWHHYQDEQNECNELLKELRNENVGRNHMNVVNNRKTVLDQFPNDSSTRNIEK